MKKSLIVLAAISMIALMFTGCPSSTDPAPQTSDPATTKPEEKPEEKPAVRKWAATIDGASVTDNGDGTCSITTKSQYSGGGMVVYLNEDKSDIAEGKTVVLEFDYETVEGAWKDSTLNPKFCATLGKDITSIWSVDGCSDTKYMDGNALKGSLTMEVVAKKAANEVFLKFNAYQWGGDAANDQLKITLKKITIK